MKPHLQRDGAAVTAAALHGACERRTCRHRIAALRLHPPQPAAATCGTSSPQRVDGVDSGSRSRHTVRTCAEIDTCKANEAKSMGARGQGAGVLTW